mmetsp:Transcript_28200/g.71562  ORF Transcript_28200/g.71562 Transcript_28200/m.71562 type:complete len:108 (-) Transcript_28200:1597-1920(-)
MLAERWAYHGPGNGGGDEELLLRVRGAASCVYAMAPARHMFFSPGCEYPKRVAAADDKRNNDHDGASHATHSEADIFFCLGRKAHVDDDTNRDPPTSVYLALLPRAS